MVGGVVSATLHGDVREIVDAFREFRRTLWRLSMVSDAPIQNYAFAPPEVRKGERWRVDDRKQPIPLMGQYGQKGGDSSVPYGPARTEDGARVDDLRHHSGFRQLSAEHFEWRFNVLNGTGRITASSMVRLRDEAQEALKGWMHTPLPSGVDPVKGDPMFPRFLVAELRRGEDAGALARKHSVSRQYVAKLRKDYLDGA